MRTDLADCLAVLALRSRSDSLDFRAYAEPMAGGSVLDWGIARLGQALFDGSDGRLVIVVEERAEVGRVACALSEVGRVEIHATSFHGQLRDLERLATTIGKTRLLYVDLTAALLPAELLRRFVRHHTASGSHITTLTGLPCTTAPLLAEYELLHMLTSEMRGVLGTAVSPDLVAAVAGLERAVRAGVLTPSIRVSRFLPLTANELEERGWPYRASLDSPRDVEILRRAVDGSSSPWTMARGSSEPLDGWSNAVRDSPTADLTRRPTGPAAPRDARRTSKRRVLYVQNPSAFTGVEQVLVHLASAIRGSAHYEAAALIALSGLLTRRLAEGGVDVQVARRDFAVSSVEHYAYCRHMLQRIRPVLVHAHTVAGVPFGCAVAEAQLPFIQHVHVANPGGLDQLSDQIISASVVVTVSDFVRQRVLRLGVDPNRVRVIRNGVPMPEADRHPDRAHRETQRLRTRAESGIPEGAPVILMPARFGANKRHDVALAALAQLAEWVPNVHLVLAGEAFVDERQVLHAVEDRIDRWKLRGRVHLLGFKHDTSGLYATADVMLLPSEDDPLPLTVLEAMAAGVPVVAARSGGTPEMIEHGRSGLLIEPGDAEGFADAVLRVITDDKHRTNLVAGALERCRTEFSLARFVHDVICIYDSLLNKGDASHLGMSHPGDPHHAE